MQHVHHYGVSFTSLQFTLMQEIVDHFTTNVNIKPFKTSTPPNFLLEYSLTEPNLICNDMGNKARAQGNMLIVRHSV